MKRTHILLAFVLCLALLIVALPGLTSCGGDKEETLKVGIMTPHTGKAAEKGVPLRDGNLDCIKYINEELGGVNGYKIEAINLDSKYEAAQAVNDINKFMDEGCLFFTTSASTEMDYVKEIANRNEFPGLVAYSSPSNYRPPQHVYGQAPDYGDDWTAFADYYMKNIWHGEGKPKMALHLLNNPTGAGANNAVKAFADELGIEVVAIEEHTTTTISEMESLTRIKAMNPDVLYISSTPAPAAVIIQNAVDLGMFPGITIGCCHAAMVKSLVDLGGADVVEGVYGVGSAAPWGADVPGTEKMLEYCEELHPDDYGNPDYATAWAQSLIVAEILRKALENVGYDAIASGDVEAWRNIEIHGFQALDGYDVEGLQPPVNYTEGDNRLSKSLRVFQVQNGGIVPITDWIEAPVVQYENFDWFTQ